MKIIDNNFCDILEMCSFEAFIVLNILRNSNIIFVVNEGGKKQIFAFPIISSEKLQITIRKIFY